MAAAAEQRGRELAAAAGADAPPPRKALHCRCTPKNIKGSHATSMASAMQSLRKNPAGRGRRPPPRRVQGTPKNPRGVWGGGVCARAPNVHWVFWGSLRTPKKTQ